MSTRQTAPKRQPGAGAFLRGGAEARDLPRGLAALWAMGIFALLLLVMTVFGDHGLIRIRQMSRDRAGLEERIVAMEAETADLRRRLEDHREGRVPSEVVARQRLGLVRPGEVVYDFRPDPLQ